ncbi:MAG: ribonuclease III [Mobiluncus porci]|uniref:ribonuclease III n=1 Tax=Mobiluncus TaxID=2050 RepID=UPI0023F428F0|nr:MULTISPECIES: ribonuclease III [Mobiluncus]MCI6584928.1 ribonuclease III [Mobiluncus sp.]MDD7542250.1 ribonuclease III [Mobiluncus porci]MDY5749049.1 ribonuclease III [Mobiluncus porci]
MNAKTTEEAPEANPEVEPKTPAERKATLSRLLADWGGTVDPELLVVAMTHRSFAHEHGKTGSTGTNERLEFLGDAVLQIIVTEYLFRNYPDEPEGDLAPMRAATVSQQPLAEVARQIRLGDYLLLGKGEDRQNGRDKDSILSDTLEALIGATYLSSGLESTRVVVERHLRRLLRNAPRRAVAMDWKTNLQETLNQRGLGEVTYHLTEKGPDHNKRFHVKAEVNGEIWGEGEGSSKKTAEHNAAKAVMDTLFERYPEEPSDA